MKTKLLKMVRENHTDRYLQLQLARAVDWMGDKWSLSKTWTPAELQAQQAGKNSCVRWECTFRRTA